MATGIPHTGRDPDILLGIGTGVVLLQALGRSGDSDVRSIAFPQSNASPPVWVCRGSSDMGGSRRSRHSCIMQPGDSHRGAGYDEIHSVVRLSRCFREFFAFLPGRDRRPSLGK